MKRLTIIIFGVCLIFCASLSNAQPRHRQAQQGEMKQRGARLMEGLDLSNEQKEQIHQLRMDNKKKSIETNAKLKIARIELHELVAGDEPDQKKVDAKISMLGKLQSERMAQQINTTLAIKKVLTPEQREKAKELRHFQGEKRKRGDARMKKNRQGRFGKRQGMREFREGAEL